MVHLVLTLALGATFGAQETGTLPLPPRRHYDVAWKKDLVEKPMLEWKPLETAGPAVDSASGTVVVGTRDGALRAYAPDGKELWEVRTEGPVGVAARIAGGLVYAGNATGRLRALDLASGKERWRYDCREEIASTPAVANGLVYFTTQQDTLYAVDAGTGAWKWHHRREGKGGMSIRGVAGPAVAKDLVYTAYSDGSVAALDAGTGAVRWERRVAPAGDFSDIDSTPQVDGARLYVAAYSGAVLALDARTGGVEWQVKAPGAARLVLAGDILVAVTLKDVLALSPKNGAKLWSAPLDGSPAGDPLVARSRVLVPNMAGLLLLDRATGRKLDVFARTPGVSATPALLGRRLYGISNTGVLYALDLQ